MAALAVALFARATGLTIKYRAERLKGSGPAFMLIFGGILASWLALDGGVHPTTTKVFRIILISLLIGVGEELTFRGVCLESLTKVTRTGTALLFSSFLFGASHFSNIWVGQSIAATRIQVVAAMLGGLFFGRVYLKTGGGLWIAILAHAVYDGMLFSFAISQAGIGLIVLALFPMVLMFVFMVYFRAAVQRIR